MCMAAYFKLRLIYIAKTVSALTPDKILAKRKYVWCLIKDTVQCAVVIDQESLLNCLCIIKNETCCNKISNIEGIKKVTYTIKTV